MSLKVVEHYFRFLRKCLRSEGFFYCCNRTRKELPGGEVSEFEKYPWADGDKRLIDAPCPWHNYFFSKAAAKHGPRVFGKRIPFVNYYDGPHRHCLSLLTK